MFNFAQPPSGGCVLKQPKRFRTPQGMQAAAFGRLCVETNPRKRWVIIHKAAAFGRLCVETV